MRTFFLGLAVFSFVALGAIDLFDGRPATGTASLLLAAVNLLLFV